MTAWIQHVTKLEASLHLHHDVVQQGSVQQLREVQAPVPVHWHECLHLSEMPVSGLTGQLFGNQGRETLFSVTYPGYEWAQHELIQTRWKESRFHLCQSSRAVSPNRMSQLIQLATC